ncbi:MAG: HAD family phosphatase [Ruminococcaceae bacterium]|nr:HAD family phosphatase [Oscillospiraceae bacterium]
MLIFDMDGTLIDSNGIWREVDIAFLDKRGLPYTKEYYEGVAHTIFPLAAVFTKEFCHLEESCEEIMAEWMELAGDMYATSVTVKPGVRAYLEQCKTAGERMMVLTSSVPEHCRTALTHLELMPYFERVIFAQELGLEKKNPDCFRRAAAMMGVVPQECTVYDDSVAACRGAKAAGMSVVGVYDDYFSATVDEMRRVCDRYILSFEELTENA